MDMFRRSLMKGAGASGALAVALATGLLKPTRAIAAEQWNQAAFDAKDVASALKGIGAENITDSADIKIKAPDIAENGAVVRVEVASNIANTASIAIFSLKNPLPLAASFDVSNGAVPEVTLNVRLAETTMVKAVVKTTDGKSYSAQKEVKVTVGGCGG